MQVTAIGRQTAPAYHLDSQRKTEHCMSSDAVQSPPLPGQQALLLPSIQKPSTEHSQRSQDQQQHALSCTQQPVQLRNKPQYQPNEPRESAVDAQHPFQHPQAQDVQRASCIHGPDNHSDDQFSGSMSQPAQSDMSQPPEIAIDTGTSIEPQDSTQALRTKLPGSRKPLMTIHPSLSLENMQPAKCNRPDAACWHGSKSEDQQGHAGATAGESMSSHEPTQKGLPTGKSAVGLKLSRLKAARANIKAVAEVCCLVQLSMHLQ